MRKKGDDLKRIAETRSVKVVGRRFHILPSLDTPGTAAALTGGGGTRGGAYGS